MRPDVALIASSPAEREAVIEAFAQATGEPAAPHTADELAYLDLGSVANTRVVLLCSEPGSFTPRGSRATVNRAINALAPVAFILLGAATGLAPDRQAVGDVLVSEKLAADPAWNKGVAALAPDRKVRASALLNLRMGFAAQNWTGAPPYFGTWVGVDNAVDRARLGAAVEDAVVADREVLGVHAACAAKNLDWIGVKGIGGFGAGEADAAAATARAAAFVLHALQLTGSRGKRGKR